MIELSLKNMSWYDMFLIDVIHLVIYTIFVHLHILLMGDAGFLHENYILDEYNLSKMDILKVGHHGSKYSSSFQFTHYILSDITLNFVGGGNSC